MDTTGEDDRPWRSDFSAELESPFLEAKLFTREEDEFATHLAILEPVSPFLNETEMDWIGFKLPALENPDQASEDDFSQGETGVINGDNRLRIKKTVGIPWRWICKIAIRDSKGRDAESGTGVLISNRHVLTAAHVVYQQYIDPISYSIEVIPALNWGDEPFGSYPLASKPKIPKRYDPKSKDHLDFDYALLTLNTRIGSESFAALGKRPLCYWGHLSCGVNTFFQRLDPKGLNGKAVYTAGYPGQKGGKQLWCASGILHSANLLTRTMYITADTTRGQSGSPVWVLEGKKYFLVGIAAGAGTNSNVVVRITRELIRQVRAWINEDGDAPTMIVTEAAHNPSEFEDRPESEAFSGQEDEVDRGEELEDWEWESGEEEAEEGSSEPDLHADTLLEAPFYTERKAEDLTFESEWTEREEGEEFDFLKENLFEDEEASPDEEASLDLEEDEFYQGVQEAEQNSAIPASIAKFAISLGKDWSQRRNGNPTADAITRWLLQDYQDTLTGAQHRWGDRFNTGILTVNAIGKAWMVSRQENMQFQLLSSGFSALKNFHPPKSRIALVPSNLIEDSDKAPVAPIMVQFVKALRQHYPSFHASTYRGHGGGDFLDRGYSIDLFLQGRDSRGFYPVDDAVKFLRAMHETAAEVNAEWRVIYNDFSAAKVINQETGQYHVIFVGKASQNSQKKVNGIIWHGPEPLILHFHLDLVPRDSEANITIPSTHTSATTSTSGAINWSSGLTPPTDSNKYRKFRLTTYHVADQKDYPTGAVRVPIFDENGHKIAEGSPRFFARLSLEGSALLTDGRLIKVTGKTVPAQHSDYADVLIYHNQAYVKRNEKRRQEGRGPVSTQYSGIIVKNGQIVKASAFHEIPRSKIGVGYGIQRNIPLTPFRTLAADIGYQKYASVDPKWKGKGGLVPAGTHVYIKEYDGLKLPDGRIHDGWFIVNDTGGAIFGAHFDVFVGTLSMHNQIKKLPLFGQVWFDGIEQRIPVGYTRGLKP